MSLTPSFTNTNPCKLVKDIGVTLCLQQFLPPKVSLAAHAWVSAFPQGQGRSVTDYRFKACAMQIKNSMT